MPRDTDAAGEGGELSGVAAASSHAGKAGTGVFAPRLWWWFQRNSEVLLEVWFFSPGMELGLGAIPQGCMAKDGEQVGSCGAGEDSQPELRFALILQTVLWETQPRAAVLSRAVPPTPLAAASSQLRNAEDVRAVQWESGLLLSSSRRFSSNLWGFIQCGSAFHVRPH